MTFGFAQRFAVTLSTVVWKLTDPENIYGLASTAEEIALKYVIDTAEALLRSRLGARGEVDYDDVRDALFEDDEYESLWQPQQGQSRRGFSMGNLEFEEWFLPFREDEQVHPFVQVESPEFMQLWASPQSLEDIEDPGTEIFLELAEDWLDVPNDIADQIPAIVEEARFMLFPDRAPDDHFTAAERQQIYQSAAEDVRVLLLGARSARDKLYDVWLIKEPNMAGAGSRFLIQGGLGLTEALDLRKIERLGDVRSAIDLDVRVYPQGHLFDRTLPETKRRPVATPGEFREPWPS